MDTRNISNKIDFEKKKRKLSDTDIASTLGVTPQAVYGKLKRLKDGKDIGILKLSELCKAIGIEITEVL